MIAYLSLSGNVRKFVERVGMKSVEIDYSNPLTEVNDDFILIIPSYDDEITQLISEFVEYKNNLKHLVGVVGSGNINFGEDGYCFNAVEISKKYSKPLLFKFEYEGTDDDIIRFNKEVDKVGIAKAK